MKSNGEMNSKTCLDPLENWTKYAKVYDPIKCASIDGIDTEPHDRAVIRALNSTYKPNRFVKGRPECTIFVSRLNHETSKETIKEIFSKYGKLKRFRMVKDIVTGMPKGYAFVEFEQEQAAEDAYRIANKTVVDGNIIFVDFECERLLKGWRPRRLGGGFAGKKESGQLRFGGRDRPFKKPIALELKEKEEKKQKEKKRRREDEQRHRRDKSRERYKRRSPPTDHATNVPPKAKSRLESPLRDKAKQTLSEKEKEIDRSPPNKIARLDSKETNKRQPPPRESTKYHSPQRHNIKQHSPKRNLIKQRSPQSDHVKGRSFLPENVSPDSPVKEVKSTSQKNGHQYPEEKIKRHSSPTDKTRTGSPFQKISTQPSPLKENADRRLRENLRHISPPREHIRSYSNRQENADHYFDTRRDNIKQKHYSPVRDQNIERYSPLENNFRSNVKEHDRRRSPLHKNDLSHSSAHRHEHYFTREDVRYRPPVRQDGEHTSPRRNERMFSPPRENDRSYFPSKDNIRYRSPVRENIARRPVAPQMGKNRKNSPVREFTKRYSSPEPYQQFSSSRDIRHSAPSANIDNFQIRQENTNYPPPYYSESQAARDFSPVRENTRRFSPDATASTNFRRVDFPSPRDNARYFPPTRENERQYFHAKDNASYYPPTTDPGNYEYYPHEQTSTNFSPTHQDTQFSELRDSRDWHSNLQNRGRRFPSHRGKYRGSFKRY